MMHIRATCSIVAGVLSGALVVSAAALAANPNTDQMIQALAPPAPSSSPAAPSDVPQGGQSLAAQQGGQLAPQLKLRGIKTSVAKRSADEEERHGSVDLDVKFLLNSAELTPEAKQVIKQLADALNSPQLKASRFLLEGHTDSTGQSETNVTLSMRRAESVRDYLMQAYGVSASRLQVVGKGDTEPRDPANPTSGVNRRVQVVNLGQ